MSYQISSPESSEPMQRVYTDLKGVDFSSIPSRVASYRSPEAKNVYKNYLSQLGQAIETRPGIENLGGIVGIADNSFPNHDFSSEDSNWISANVTGFEIDSGIAQFTATAQGAYIKRALENYEQYGGHKVYISGKIKSSSSAVKICTNDGTDSGTVSHSGSGNYETLSFIVTINENPSLLEIKVQDDRSEGWDEISVDEIVLIDLTQKCGTGYEPDLESVDSLVESNKIYGIHILSDTKALLHCGEKLYIWNSFPASSNKMSSLSDTGIVMNKEFSTSFIYNGSLYLLDGLGYYVYNGTTVSAVTGYVPTTSTGASPDGSNRTIYQAVNYISDYRKNSFVGDSESATYYLDTKPIDEISQVVVSSRNNGEPLTIEEDYNIDIDNGTITFISTANNAATTPGQDNIFITFKKTVSGYADHIKKCTLAKVFDNRVFLSGNNDYRGVLFHSELDNPAYFSDENWYMDGADNASVKSIVSASDKMVCIKEDLGQGVKVYYHTVSYDSTYGSIYPVSETEIHLGAFAEGINFRDTIVYLSKQGLESVYSTSQLLHKSSLVDTKLINEAGLEDAKMAIWNNYLCILVNGKIYLADSRQQTDTGEYEWYYWDNAGIWYNNTSPSFSKAVSISEYGGKLYLGTENGYVFTFNNSSDCFSDGETELIQNSSADKIVNIVLNGNFSKKELEEIVWEELLDTALTVENGEAKILSAQASGGIKQNLDHTKYAGKNIYVCALIKASSNTVSIEIYDDTGSASRAHSGSGKYEFLSLIKTVPLDAAELDIRICDRRISNWDYVYVSNVIALDLDAIPEQEIQDKASADSFINDIFKKYSINYFQFAAYSQELYKPTALPTGKGRVIQAKGNDESAAGSLTIIGYGENGKNLCESVIINSNSFTNTVNEYIAVTDIFSQVIENIDLITVNTCQKMVIDNCWTTPMDVFNTLTHLKTTNKRGGVVQVKRIPNSVFKIDVSTDKESWQNILSSYTTGFSFENMRLYLLETPGYEHFSFGTGARGFLVFKVKKRKIKYFSIKFYSDEVDRPFGLYEATIEFTVDNYVKN